MNYLVEWTIDIEADTAEEAVQEALAIQRDPDSVALYFKVTDSNGKTSTVDLSFE